MKIVYSRIARHDLKEVYDYISKGSVRYALREIQLIRAAVRKLETKAFLLGRKFEKSDDELTREMIFRNYRIVYDIYPDEYINILSVHHHSRNLDNNPAFDADNE
jgi:toxin ParE1/3/4